MPSFGVLEPPIDQSLSDLLTPFLVAHLCPSQSPGPFILVSAKQYLGEFPDPAPFLLKVILAVTVCTRAGKLVMSRQFVEMTRIRIEGLVAAFPKLLGGAGKQHTFVETDNVR